jgi:putative ABC transport system permease protein
VLKAGGATRTSQLTRLGVEDTTAKTRHLAVGDTIEMGFPSTTTRTMTTGGIYKAQPLAFPLGAYTASDAFVAANTNQVLDEAIGVQASGASLSSLQQAIAAFPNVKMQTSAQFQKDQQRQLTTILSVVYVLLALSIVIALVGVVNTLALSVIERTHEIGLLRAVGMHRRQVRRMIRGEAVLVSLVGAILGLVLGVGLGLAIVASQSSNGLTTFSIPTSTIATVLVLMAIFGVGAAIWPARRAARTDVLGAIATT